jgi:hypothetical protein
MIEAEIVPAGPERWSDLERLSGERGACGGCWCMSWRLPRAVFNAQKGEGNRRELKAPVESGRAPGLIAYVDGAPAGWWCASQRCRSVIPI